MTNQNEEKNPLDNLMEYYENNKKRANTISTVVLVAIVGAIGYFKFFQEPKVEKAATSIAFAQRMLDSDSVDVALNGNAGNAGFLKIHRKYSGTPTANLCNYYIGICYLRKGEYNNAIKYLEDFNGKGTMLENVANGVLGDAYMESGNTEKGISQYLKAAKDDNEMTAPLYLQRAAVAYEMQNNNEKAAETYKKIKSQYPNSPQAQDIDRYLARLGVLN